MRTSKIEVRRASEKMMGFGGGRGSNSGSGMQKCRCKNEEMAAGQSHARTHTIPLLLLHDDGVSGA